AVIVATADGCNRAVRVAARRPDIVRAVVTVGGAPVGRPAMQGLDAMIASETVVGAFLDLAETDYRSALRGVMTATNQQLDEDGFISRPDQVAAVVRRITAKAPAQAPPA